MMFAGPLTCHTPLPPWQVSWDSTTGAGFKVHLLLGDRMLRLWDSAQPRSTACVGAHSGEILACDWSKYDQNVIFTAGVDTTIKLVLHNG